MGRGGTGRVGVGPTLAPPITDIVWTGSHTVVENSPLGTTVGGALSAIGTTAKFSLVTDAGGLFGIGADGTSIVVTGIIDYEAATSYNITVRASDSTGRFYDKVFAVTVTAETTGPPSILTGLIGWWDSSVTASLNLTGSSINSVADQSGGGNTMSWVNAKPTYSATGFNSAKPAIVLGSSSALQATPFPMGAGTTLTVWYVGTVGGVDSGRSLNYFKPGFPDYNNAGSFAILRSSGTAVQFYHNNGPTTASGLAAHPAPIRYIFTINSSGVKTPYVNGVAFGTTSAATAWVTGGTAQIGRQDSSNGNYWTGPIAEAGIATGYSDATTVGLLDTYLKNKWGL